LENDFHGSVIGRRQQGQEHSRPPLPSRGAWPYTDGSLPYTNGAWP